MGERLATRAARGGVEGDPFRSLVTPIYVSTVYEFLPGDLPEAWGRLLKYGREENPTVRLAERRLAAIEEARDTLLFSAGMAAVAAVLVWGREQGFRRLVVPMDVYSATLALVKRLGPLLGYEVRIVEPGTEAVAAGMGRGSLVLVETVSNALLRVYDVELLAREAGASEAVLVVDNTIATPVNARLARLGVSLAVYSATKHLAGHNDAVAGAIVDYGGGAVQRLWEWRKLMGTIASPFTAYLVERGLKTIHVRVEAHNANAARVAARLAEAMGVDRVVYPCLDGHPDRQVARRLLRGCGSLLLVDLGDGDRARRFLESLRLVRPGTSFGGPESLAVHMASGPASSFTPEERRRLGIGDGLVRVHVGLEDPDDVAEDLLSAARRAGVRLRV